MVMDPYQILGVDKSASIDEVKRAYRKKARENHPDLNPGDEKAAERMNQVNEAYDRIINPDKYAQEDARRAAAEAYARGGSDPTGYGYASSPFGGSYSSNPFGWDNFTYEDIFGAYSGSAQVRYKFHPEANPSDSGVVMQAISAINTDNFKMAINLLETLKSPERNARWYYLSAIANYGANNLMKALDHIKTAMKKDPTNAIYKQTAQKMQQTGQTYRQTSKNRGFNMSAIDPTTCCCICLGINMCLGGGLGVPLCFFC